jgi:hypothetical protein
MASASKTVAPWIPSRFQATVSRINSGAGIADYVFSLCCAHKQIDSGRTPANELASFAHQNSSCHQFVQHLQLVDQVSCASVDPCATPHYLAEISKSLGNDYSALHPTGVDGLIIPLIDTRHQRLNKFNHPTESASRALGVYELDKIYNNHCRPFVQVMWNKISDEHAAKNGQGHKGAPRYSFKYARQSADQFGAVSGKGGLFVFVSCSM